VLIAVGEQGTTGPEGQPGYLVEPRWKLVAGRRPIPDATAGKQGARRLWERHEKHEADRREKAKGAFAESIAEYRLPIADIKWVARGRFGSLRKPVHHL